jgi:hypothetical protein
LDWRVVFFAFTLLEVHWASGFYNLFAFHQTGMGGGGWHLVSLNISHPELVNLLILAIIYFYLFLFHLIFFFSFGTPSDTILKAQRLMYFFFFNLRSSPIFD